VRMSSSSWQQPVPVSSSAARLVLLDVVAGVVDRLGAQRLAVVVDGPTGAGKTSFGHELGQALERIGRPVCRASLDDFKRPWAERHLYDRETGEGYYRNAFDVSRVLHELIARVRTDGVVRLCGVDPLTQVDHRDDCYPMPPSGVLVVDGVFALRPELRDAWDLAVWLDVTPEVALDRGVLRDTAREGSDRALRTHRDRYLPAEVICRREANPRAQADIVVDNNDLSAPALAKSVSRGLGE
jgi:uridine kinase